MQEFAGQAAVVTGSASGIGQAIAAELAGMGSKVVGVDKAPQVGGPVGVTPLQADLLTDDPTAIAGRVIEVNGPPTLIVNNVGIDLPGGFLNGSAEVLDRTWVVNLRAPWLLTRALIEPLVVAGRSASVIFISSLHSGRTRTHPHYSTSKAAVAMLVEEMAHELGPLGIRVNAVSPGVIASSSVMEAAGEKDDERLRRLIPMGRMGRPEDVAHVVTVLLSDRLAGYVTGANLKVDGGLGTFTWSDQP